MTILNIAAYRFVPLPDAARLVAPLRERACALQLKGTILVAAEGINLFLAGDADAVDAFIAWLGVDPLFVDDAGKPAFADLSVKRSRSTRVPFRRLRVRHRSEIVTMRRAAVRPAAGRAPAVAPERLAAWLSQGHDDDGRPLVLLDTRNAFEVDAGAFDGSRHLDLARFDAFPDAADAALAQWKDATLVTYCTGGIRCEKAALHLQAAGHRHVVQLDGGILGYFERVGGLHWRGRCFVFDERVTLDPGLRPQDD